jgi:hypothetical protein
MFITGDNGAFPCLLPLETTNISEIKQETARIFALNSSTTRKVNFNLHLIFIEDVVNRALLSPHYYI